MNTSVIVTGASGNLGGVVVQKLKSAGYTVLGTVGSQGSAASLQKQGIMAAPLDLSDEAAVQQYVAGLDTDVSAAVLTVGGFTAGGFDKTDGETLRKMYSLNFETAYFLVRALLPVFASRGGGQVILVGTRPALLADEGKNLIAYSLSKKLVFYLAELINAHGREKNINATVIVPSTIDTPPNRKAMPDADFSKWVTPEAIADTIHFLLSDSGRQVRESVIKLYNEA